MGNLTLYDENTLLKPTVLFQPKQSTCYWPDSEQTDVRREFGDYVVTLKKRDVQHDYVDCTLELMDIEVRSPLFNLSLVFDLLLLKSRLGTEDQTSSLAVLKLYSLPLPARMVRLISSAYTRVL